ncbi:MAG: SpoIIE family protein phosphatase [Spirochaetales bacterium]|nr:SpoIIE family protein phosphatase [Spirochaetales bacterium]
MKKKIIALSILLILTPGLWSQNINWETPRVLVSQNARFPTALSGDGTIVIVYQSFYPYANGGGTVFLNILVSRDTRNWKSIKEFSGPYEYSDKQNQIYSALMTKNGDIYIAVAADEYELEFLKSIDKGLHFEKSSIKTNDAVLSSYISEAANSDILFFVTFKIGELLKIYYSRLKPDGIGSPNLTITFNSFVTDPKLGLNILPHHSVLNNSDYVVFQSLDAEAKDEYQLFLKSSDNKDVSFGPPILLTDLKENINSATPPYDQFENQRPYTLAYNNGLQLVWERAFRNLNSQIYIMNVNIDGSTENFEKVSPSTYLCHNPQIIIYNDQPYLLWFDKEYGDEQIKLAYKRPLGWQEINLSLKVGGVNLFPQIVETKGFLYLFWEHRDKDRYSLYFLEPDQNCDPPKINNTSFVPNQKSNQKDITIRWTSSEDSSGIFGYRYIFSQEAKPDWTDYEEIYSDVKQFKTQVNLDGNWYFHIKAGDNADNWSDPVTVSFQYDSTPPEAIRFLEAETDEKGFLLSNDISINWLPSEIQDLGGYSYSLNFISGKIDQDLNNLKNVPFNIPPNRITSFDVKKSYKNLDNGIYAFTLRAFDDVGNPGPLSRYLFKLNKYIPYTTVSVAYSVRDKLDNQYLYIKGKGFLADGSVYQIFLDQDQKAPYDYSYFLNQSDYRISDDKVIEQLKLENIDEGIYHLGLYHQKRGLYWYGEKLFIEPSNNVVILPENPVIYSPPWYVLEKPVFFVSGNDLLLVVVLIFAGLIILAATRQLVVIYNESQSIREEVITIMTGKESKSKKKAALKKIKTMGLGLRVKFTLLITSLVIVIVLMVSVTLSLYAIETQQKNLTEGLQNQVKVMLGSLSSGAEKYLPTQDTLELGLLITQTSAMKDAISASITGIRKRGSNLIGDTEYIFATNDKELLENINFGETILDDEISPLLKDIATKINQQANEAVSDLAQEVNELIQESNQLLTRRDDTAIQRRAQIQEAVRVKNQSIANLLMQIAQGKDGLPISVPAFNPDNLASEYTFFRPLVYRRLGEDVYFRGLVRLKITSASIIKNINESRDALIIRIMLIALIAVVLGMAGAFLLASITISPIKKLVRGVAMIRDTADKAELKGHMIEIKQKDEIRMLADTVNQMTQGLVKAAEASKDLTVGKEVQKMFIPLGKNEAGKKGTIGEEINENIEIFGYYEGAKGVSGDYFDFIKLDNTYMAFIKCDVAGKGVPAALIMVEVATIFIDYFRDWSLKNKGIKLPEVIYKINDMLESRGFKGRFAALIMGIMNIKSGEIHFCDAGDRVYHQYDAAQGKVMTKLLPEAPAAGVFPSMLLEMQSGFQQVKEKVSQGDMLFFFSDGFDEAKRMFRDAEYKPIVCDAPGLTENQEHNKTHKKGDDNEEFGLARMYGIIEAVINKGKYELIKEHDPYGIKMVFDFSDCSDNIKDIVMALVAVERIYRINPHPSATEEDRIIMDKKVNAFLEEHFEQYGLFFRYPQEIPNDMDYTAFTHLKQDEQYDDLTFLAIKKK